MALLSPLGFRRNASATAIGNSAVAWRYGETDAEANSTAVSPRRKWRTALASMLALELTLAGIAGAALLDTNSVAQDVAMDAEEWDAFVALHTTWCRTVESVTGMQISLGE